MMYIVFIIDNIHHLMNELKMLIFAYNSDRLTNALTNQPNKFLVKNNVFAFIFISIAEDGHKKWKLINFLITIRMPDS